MFNTDFHSSPSQKQLMTDSSLSIDLSHTDSPPFKDKDHFN